MNTPWPIGAEQEGEDGVKCELESWAFSLSRFCRDVKDSGYKSVLHRNFILNIKSKSQEKSQEK